MTAPPPDAAQAYRRALAWLTQREHSAAEICRKLRRLGTTPDMASALVDRLQDEGWLSDQRFVEAFVHSRQQRGDGPLRIAAALQQRGIDRNDTPGYDEQHWYERLLELYRQRYGLAPPQDAADRARRIRYLQRRGYPPALIARCLREPC